MYPILLALGPVVIPSYGVMMVLAFFAGAFVVWKKGREEHFGEDELFDLTLLVTFWGILGGRVVWVLTRWGEFWPDVLKMIALTRYPGLSLWGAVAAGALVVWQFATVKRWRFFEIADVVVVGAAVAGVGGSLGAFLNGSGYGVRTNLPWGVVFPGVEGVRHPTQLYLLGLWLATAVLLWRWLDRYRTFEWYKAGASQAAAGLVTGAFTAGFGLMMVVEAALTPVEVAWGGVNVELVVAMATLVLGGVMVYGRSQRKLGEDIKTLRGKFKRVKKSKEKVDGEAKVEVHYHRRRRRRERQITAGMDVKI